MDKSASRHRFLQHMTALGEAASVASGGGFGGFGGSMRRPTPSLSLAEADELVTHACLCVGALGVFQATTPGDDF